MLNGKGNVNLNCMRIWESLFNGAIPVTLGNDLGPFAYYVGPYQLNGSARVIDIDTVPWITESFWTSARLTVDDYLLNKDKMDALQQDVLRWWNTTLCSLKTQIAKSLAEDINESR